MGSDGDVKSGQMGMLESQSVLFTCGFMSLHGVGKAKYGGTLHLGRFSQVDLGIYMACQKAFFFKGVVSIHSHTRSADPEEDLS